MSSPVRNGKAPRAAVFIDCPCCKGSGRVELTGVYAETLAALRRQKGERNGSEIARSMGVPETAMNNRLVKLEGLGLAAGRRCGRQRLWSAVKGVPGA